MPKHSTVPYNKALVATVDTGEFRNVSRRLVGKSSSFKNFLAPNTAPPTKQDKDVARYVDSALGRYGVIEKSLSFNFAMISLFVGSLLEEDDDGSVDDIANYEGHCSFDDAIL